MPGVDAAEDFVADYFAFGRDGGFVRPGRVAA